MFGVYVRIIRILKFHYFNNIFFLSCEFEFGFVLIFITLTYIFSVTLNHNCSYLICKVYGGSVILPGPSLIQYLLPGL